MILPASWRDGEVAVIGLGRSGVAATRLLVSEGVRVYASDASPAPAAAVAVEALRTLLGVTVDLGRHDVERIRRAVLVVVSPGVPPEAPPLAAARAAGVPIISELDLGFRALGTVPCIAVTGTNGKTTTTALVAHLLRTAGLRADAAGNIGRPLADVALDPAGFQWLAVEVSSFQLHDSPDFAPVIGVLTNLSPDHLDRYPGVDAYYADKRLLFRNATDSSVWVVNADDPATGALAAGARGRVVRFSLRGPADGWFDAAERILRLGGAGLLPRDLLPLLGDHNVANALAAALAVTEAGIGPAVIAEGLRSFRALPHRLELVGEVGGVQWINDSKATNVASTLVAVQAMERPFVLLLGGRHKGEPYTALGPLLKQRCRLIVAYGESGDLVEQDLKGSARLERGGDFEDVMSRARKAAKPGDAVLLSPACSSYDMFKNYEERGDVFRRLALAS
jgi:UDP-N-acetylmuramoylalanine--D-glutamate ligase